MICLDYLIPELSERHIFFNLHVSFTPIKEFYFFDHGKLQPQTSVPQRTRDNAECLPHTPRRQLFPLY